MTGFFEAFSQFLATGTIWVYLVIFLGKIVEVSLGTLRIVLINRGERLIGSLIALIEISLWLIIAGNVLTNYQSDPLKMVAYALAYAMGNYVGSWLEERLAFGLCSMQTVVMDRETSEKITAALRQNGFGVTELAAQGRDDQTRYLLISTLRRKLADDGTAGVAQAERLCHLVERLAHRIIDGGAQGFIVAPVAHVHEHRMAAAHERHHHGRLDVGARDAIGIEVAFQVIHGDKRLVDAPRRTLGEGQTHHQCAHQTGSIGDCDGVQVAPTEMWGGSAEFRLRSERNPVILTRKFTRFA